MISRLLEKDWCNFTPEIFLNPKIDWKVGLISYETDKFSIVFSIKDSLVLVSHKYYVTTMSLGKGWKYYDVVNEWCRYVAALSKRDFPETIKRLPNIRKGEYYVYCALVDGNIKYIGKGTGKRYKHCVSGISTCYMLNKAHFEGKTISTLFVEKDLLESEAYKLEKYYINLFDKGDLFNRQLVK